VEVEMVVGGWWRRRRWRWGWGGSGGGTVMAAVASMEVRSRSSSCQRSRAGPSTLVTGINRPPLLWVGMANCQMPDRNRFHGAYQSVCWPPTYPEQPHTLIVTRRSTPHEEPLWSLIIRLCPHVMGSYHIKCISATYSKAIPLLLSRLIYYRVQPFHSP
jgi:hypothetical protein